ncbi:MAG: 2-oxoacid:acceptor oxidoreductase family protein [Bryobacteraceae bacterium]
MLKELRIAGFGGQGVILATHILGRAAAVHENRFATMTQSYGPEARGGAASAALIVSDEPVLFPYVTHPDILVVMSQEAYSRFTPEVKPSGFLLVEEDLVCLDRKAQGLKIYGIPATRFAEELGKKMVLNVIMTGFLCAVTGAVGADAARKAVEESVPARFRELNLQAFDKGLGYGQELLVRGPQRIEQTEEIVLESEV